MATDTNSELCAFGPLETFTRTSCGAPAFGEIQTTNGDPVRFGDRFAISNRPSLSGAVTNSRAVFMGFCLLLIIRSPGSYPCCGRETSVHPSSGNPILAKNAERRFAHCRVTPGTRRTEWEKET